MRELKTQENSKKREREREKKEEKITYFSSLVTMCSYYDENCRFGIKTVHGNKFIIVCHAVIRWAANDTILLLSYFNSN